MVIQSKSNADGTFLFPTVDSSTLDCRCYLHHHNQSRYCTVNTAVVKRNANKHIMSRNDSEGKPAMPSEEFAKPGDVPLIN